MPTNVPADPNGVITIVAGRPDNWGECHHPVDGVVTDLDFRPGSGEIFPAICYGSVYADGEPIPAPGKNWHLLDPDTLGRMRKAGVPRK